MEYGMRLPMVGGGEKKHRVPVLPGVGVAGLENMTKAKHGTQVSYIVSIIVLFNYYMTGTFTLQFVTVKLFVC